jgi:hypothetical protein
MKPGLAYVWTIYWRIRGLGIGSRLVSSLNSRFHLWKFRVQRRQEGSQRLGERRDRMEEGEQVKEVVENGEEIEASPTFGTCRRYLGNRRMKTRTRRSWSVPW